MKAPLFALVLAVAATFAVLLRSTPTAAQSAAPAAIDCSKAETMLMEAQKMYATAPTMTGDVDKDFRAMTMAHEKATVMMDQVEASCGKDAATKAAAAAELHEAQERLHEFSKVRGD